MSWRFAARGLVVGVVGMAACSGSSGVTPPLAPSPSATAVTGTPAPPGGSPTPDAYPLNGTYDLTLSLSDSCTAVPAADRVRSYSATIAYRGAGHYVVTLSGATFLQGPICAGGGGRFEGIGCDQFFASEDIDTVNFFLENNNDDAHGAHIVEQLADGRWLEIIGQASGPYDLSSGSATGTGTAWYCPAQAAYPFPCSNWVSCPNTELRMTLRRR